MRKVREYELPPRGAFALPLHAGHEVLSFHMRDGTPSLFVAEDPESCAFPRRFRLVRTLDAAPEDGWRFIGTVVAHGIALHLFQET